MVSYQKSLEVDSGSLSNLVQMGSGGSLYSIIQMYYHYGIISTKYYGMGRIWDLSTVLYRSTLG